MELCSGELTAEQIGIELQAVVDFLVAKNVRSITVTHWFGVSKLTPLLLRSSILAGLDDTSSGTADRKVYLGSSDFRITSKETTATIEFCHEDEVHVTSDPEDTVFFLSRWKALGYPVR